MDAVKETAGIHFSSFKDQKGSDEAKQALEEEPELAVKSNWTPPPHLKAQWFKKKGE